MTTRRRAEIVGAGFAGLAAAIALAERGWSVRVHEKTPELRQEGFGVSFQENGLKTLEALGVLEEAQSGGMRIERRETRNADGRTTATFAIRSRMWRLSRQHLVRVMARRAEGLGVEIVTGSEVRGATPDGRAALGDGREVKADLIVAADGINSRIPDALGLLRRRRLLPDGAMRLMVRRIPGEVAKDDGRTGIENWSGSRRLIYSPCNEREVYLALSCLAKDAPARRVPIDVDAWSASFPALAPLLRRLAAEAEWNRVMWAQFRVVTLSRWSSGRVAVIGDAAHAMPPNLGQGACCAAMNALGLAVALEERRDVGDALKAWEARERPVIEHAQTWSWRYSWLTMAPEFVRDRAFRLLSANGWLREQHQRVANHTPTGFSTRRVSG
jgi:2-polyprenyl-6-methoxyphenol hydroxylase-like FAD-dependent oxidoreductase